MGLSERIYGTVAEAQQPMAPAAVAPADPYADLKRRVHHACILKLGPELFDRAPADQEQRVRGVVEEQLLSEDTPHTRE